MCGHGHWCDIAEEMAKAGMFDQALKLLKGARHDRAEVLEAIAEGWQSRDV
jgi:hypothetical protein